MLFLKSKVATGLFVVLSILYIAQTLLVKPDPTTLAKYHLTQNAAYVVSLTIALPYIAIWFVALIGYLRLKSYHAIIKGSKDGLAFRDIAVGVLWLGLFLPLSTLLNHGVGQYAQHHQADNLVRLVNYIVVIVLLLSVMAVHRGSCRLLSFVKSKDVVANSRTYQFSTLIFIAMSAMYVMLVLHDPTRQLPTRDVKVAGYYEPDWLLMLTIIVPRLFAWYLGLRAVINISLYRRKVNGSLYRQALKSLAFGVGMAMISMVVLRIIQTLSVQMARYSLSALLVLVYTLLLLIALGYIFIARGAKQLQRLEEI